MPTSTPTLTSTKALRHFYKQTQQVNLLSGLALFLIVFTTVAPLTLNPFLVGLLKLLAAGLLGRALYVTFTETQRLRIAQNKSSAKSFLPTLSFILCGALSVLLLYTLYTIVF
jgi:hypothetical protein